MKKDVCGIINRFWNKNNIDDLKENINEKYNAEIKYVQTH